MMMMMMMMMMMTMISTPLPSCTQPIRMIRINASTLAMVKTYCTLFVHLTLKQFIDINNTGAPTHTDNRTSAWKTIQMANGRLTSKVLS